MIKANNLVRVAPADVLRFEAQLKCTRVALKNQEGLLKMGISSVLQYLDPRQFWRIHRSIINSVHMASAARDEMGRMIVRLHFRDDRLTVSGPHKHLFKDGFS